MGAETAGTNGRDGIWGGFKGLPYMRYSRMGSKKALHVWKLSLLKGVKKTGS